MLSMIHSKIWEFVQCLKNTSLFHVKPKSTGELHSCFFLCFCRFLKSNVLLCRRCLMKWTPHNHQSCLRATTNSSMYAASARARTVLSYLLVSARDRSAMCITRVCRNWLTAPALTTANSANSSSSWKLSSCLSGRY